MNAVRLGYVEKLFCNFRVFREAELKKNTKKITKSVGFKSGHPESPEHIYNGQ